MTEGPGLARTLLPKGFQCSGVNSGVRRYRPDLGILISENPAVTAGVFTLSQCKAAPVLYSQSLVPSAKIKAIITNSGQANAATGALGAENNLKMAEAVARSLDCKAEEVLTASTGPIGVQMEIEKICAAVPELIDRLGSTAEAFAVSIMTTDLVPKTVFTKVQLAQGEVQITGICKGSGMIHPNMGTMLGYFLTDLKLNPQQADRYLRTCVDQSFNMISVDGETSTNDCTFLMANGASSVSISTEEDELLFQKALNEVGVFLAKSIARDGEGATKLIEVRLGGAPSLSLAKQAARGLVMSPLVKTAIHGGDPNWGRILARLGADQVPAASLGKMDVSLQGLLVFEAGTPTGIDVERIRSKLRDDTVIIEIDLHSGDSKTVAWGCDLSKKYVEINAEYLT